ncbi:hypothetical protein LTR95_009108 [Oleoguttula sp. CCFEE 5521]
MSPSGIDDRAPRRPYDFTVTAHLKELIYSTDNVAGTLTSATLSISIIDQLFWIQSQLSLAATIDLTGFLSIPPFPSIIPAAAQFQDAEARARWPKRVPLPEDYEEARIERNRRAREYRRANHETVREQERASQARARAPDEARQAEELRRRLEEMHRRNEQARAREQELQREQRRQQVEQAQRTANEQQRAAGIGLQQRPPEDVAVDRERQRRALCDAWGVKR